MNYILAEDFTLVTLNAQDFRGAAPHNPGGLHGVAELHAGLICLGSALELDLDVQRDLFAHALEALVDLPDLVNQSLEVWQAEDGSVEITLYDLPPP